MFLVSTFTGRRHRGNQCDEVEQSEQLSGRLVHMAHDLNGFNFDDRQADLRETGANLTVRIRPLSIRE